MYWGTWVDADNNSELIVAMADSGDEVRFDLYQDGSIEASGFVQFSQEYSGDYFYNEFDGWAHHCWLADDGTLQIEGFGGFEKDASASDMDASDTGDADADVSALAGMWYDGRRREPRAGSSSDGSGIWTLIMSARRKATGARSTMGRSARTETTNTRRYPTRMRT